MVKSHAFSQGSPRPLGASLTQTGVNFAIFSRHATAMKLCLFRDPEDGKAFAEFPLAPRTHRSGDIWHIHIEGLGVGSLYGWRADGPFLPEKGYRFNSHKLLLDPYAKAVTGNFRWDVEKAQAYDPEDVYRDLSYSILDNAAYMPKCIVIDDYFDWEGDRPLNLPLRHCVLYEAHLRSLTSHPSSGVKNPGTYQGIIESIPYLKKLGITSLELLPIQEFDEFENRNINPQTGERLTQYWGYSTLGFFAPKGSYSASGAMGQQVAEFKTMVKALHRAGIEVILDVVFNHSAEGNEKGPTISFRGLDNTIYYMLDENPRYYKNFSGCGNTFNCNHPVVRSFIMDCLHYWVVDMHVDGFRFDLGSILGRDQRGNLLENPPVIEQIAEDPILRQTKIIAEAWDAGGAYQVGSFPGGRWAEWNDRYRDDLRKFWRGDSHMTAALATRLTGSSDLYLRDGRKPFHSINYITSHDGFTLNDLVSYSRKHNEANGEYNRDGQDDNLSRNYGHEGPADDPEILATRERQTKNFMASLILSIGTPMLLAGDEFLRSQGGNNNAYCQNNETSWMDYGLAKKNSEFLDFTRRLIAFRKEHPALRRPEFFTGKDANYNALPDIAWFGPDGNPPDWEDAPGLLAARLDGSLADIMADRDDNDFFFAYNATSEDIEFKIGSPRENKYWYLVLDTSQDLPDAFQPFEDRRPIEPQTRIIVEHSSMIMLVSRAG